MCIRDRDKAAGGKDVPAAFFNGDRLHAARAAVGVEGDRERGRNHCGILPQSLDLGVSEHDVAAVSYTHLDVYKRQDER